MDPALRHKAKGILVTNAYQLSVAHRAFRMGMLINPATIDRFISTFYSNNKGSLHAYLPHIGDGTPAAAQTDQTGLLSRIRHSGLENKQYES